MLTQYQVTGNTAVSIADSLERGVVSGALAPSELLPPIRELAELLEVSPGTVASAYRLARQRGLTVSDGRRGTRVRPWRREATSAPVADDRRYRNRPAEPASPGSTASGKQVVDLASGNPDPELLPDITATLRRINYRPVSYGSPVLEQSLARIATTQLAADHVPVDHLTCTFGALDAIGRVLNSSLRPGDRVAIEDPGWPALINGLTKWGLLAVPVTVDDDGPVPDALWEALAGGTRAVVLTSRAQNPTGASITAARASALVEILARYPGVVTIEDDHGHKIANVGLHSITAAHTPSLPGPWAFVRSAAKAYGPDLRLAVLAGDATTVNRVDASLDASAGWVSHLLQQAVSDLWSNADVAQITKAAADTYDERRGALLEHLAAAQVRAVGRTGLNVWVAVDDEASCVARLWEGGWRVAGGRAFRLASEPGIRITTAALPSEQAPDLARAVAEAIGRASAGRY
ncbi:MAG: aminotransferase class I/II-fold pyridoxal phosphate-dependent enzyme [Acidimicrobiales bacterium]